MKLVITTPLSVLLEEDQVRYIRAEDETGAFGIAPGHAEFITTLEVCVITWRDSTGAEHHVAVRSGILRVAGDAVEVATRQAVGDDELERLGRTVLERFREEAREEEAAWMSATRLNVAMVRQLRRYLDAGHSMTHTGRTAYGSARERSSQ
jgi:F-type H+-transporting ATPase subunit epsilon